MIIINIINLKNGHYKIQGHYISLFIIEIIKLLYLNYLNLLE